MVAHAFSTLDKPTNWWRGNIIYQIYPRSYQDDNGDGIGDIRGITRRLDYVADLGVDTIWLSPVFTSPMKDMGYDVSDYTGIDPTFGDLTDFDAMISRAHELGLRVMIDQVISHCSNQHVAFQESRQSRDNPKAEWFVWSDGNPDGTPPNNWPAVFGGPAWEWEPKRQQFYLHNFLIEQPDFNFHNPEVQDYHLENMRFWLERGVDGFRLDTVNFYFHDQELCDNPADPRELPNYTNTYDKQYHIYSKNRPENIAFLKRMRVLCDEYDAAMVGEMGETHHPIEMMGEYTRGDDRLHMCYSFEFLDGDYTPEHFREKIEEFLAGAPDGWPSWALSNHDVQRHATRWLEHGVDQDAIAKQCAAINLSLMGSICLYQGEELGQGETELEYHELTDPPGLRFWPENKGRDGCRTPMVWEADAANAGFSDAKPWLPVKSLQAARAVDAQLGVESSVLEYYRAMIRFRQLSNDLRGTHMEFIDVPAPAMAFRRGDVICVFNMSPKSMTVVLPNGGLLDAPNIGTKISGSEITLASNAVAFLKP